jgi:hypothetical protein
VTDLSTDLDLIPESEYLELVKIRKQTAANQRSLGQGPAYVKLGNKIFYSRKTLREYVAKHTVRPKAAPTMTDGKRRGRRA